MMPLTPDEKELYRLAEIVSDRVRSYYTTPEPIYEALQHAYKRGQQSVSSERLYEKNREWTRRFEYLCMQYRDLPGAQIVLRHLQENHPGSMKPWSAIYKTVEDHLRVTRSIWIEVGFARAVRSLHKSSAGQVPLFLGENS